MVVNTDGTQMTGVVAVTDQVVWFQFDALAGETYQLETHQVTLEDTVMTLWDTDMTTEIAENDDDERVTGRLDSYIEWTCPTDGTYFVTVHAYGVDLGAFNFQVTAASASGPGDLHNPCAGGVTFDMQAATISFMPQGGTTANAVCDWVMQCPVGQVVSITFVQFQTEAHVDTVNLFDGTTEQDLKIHGANLSGDLNSLVRTQFSSTGSAMLLAFTSDGSSGDTEGRGFEAMYECAAAPPSPTPPPPLPPPVPPPPPALSGCTDATAANPTPGATADDDSCVFCTAGQYWGGSACIDCPAGTVDSDSDASTTCTPCIVGNYAAAGTTQCIPCAAGTFDQDSNPATACTPCAEGTTWNSNNRACVMCPAGTYENNGRCTDCVAGTYSIAGSDNAADCVRCSATQIDDDQDPSTPCVDRLATPIGTDGVFVTGEVTVDVEEVWYSFTAVAGTTYQLESDMCEQADCLTDTVMRLIDTDQGTVLIENDDDERVTGYLDSYIEWTCPTDGTYYVTVSPYFIGGEIGRFQVKVTEATAGDADDPCNGGVTFTGMPAATISFVSSNSAHMLCDWVVQCDPGQTISVHFSQFSTEMSVDTVNLYNGPTENDHKIRGGNLSGELADLPTADFVSTAEAMLIAFTSDASVGDTGAHGFQLDYTCVDATAPPPPPPAPPTLSVDGTELTGDVYDSGDQVVYQFTGRGGQTYQIETEQCDHAGCLEDTVMQLIDVDGTTVLVENDDDERITGMLDSFIEWTCPNDGVYYVLVKAYAADTGTFMVKVTEMSAGNGGDPCADGTDGTLMGPLGDPASTDPNDWIEAAIVSYQPQGNYNDNSICVWHIQCQPDEIVSLTFLSLSTEAGFDWVTLHGGSVQRDNFVLSQLLAGSGIALPPTENSQIVTASGEFADVFAQTGPTFTSIDEAEVDNPSAMTISFTSDASVGGEGFEASYVCEPNALILANHGCRDMNTRCFSVLRALGGVAGGACDRDMAPLLPGQTGSTLCPVSCGTCPGTGR